MTRNLDYLGKMKPVLLLGGSGQLGLALHSLIEKDLVVLLGRAEINFLLPDEICKLIIKLRPCIIVNAAAYTGVECAEIETEQAFNINSQAVACLAKAAEQVDALLVHFSTDYVFDGSGFKAWQEVDLPAPLNTYGKSKWQGEQSIIASDCRYLILRTSWLHSQYGENFLKTMLHLGKEKKTLSVICDQIGAPTSASMLAQVTLQAIDKVLLDSRLCGLYHVAASGETSWYNYACFIFEEARALGVELKVSEVKPITSHGYPALATRPLNSRLDTTKFRTTFGIELPDWRDGVRETLGQIIN